MIDSGQTVYLLQHVRQDTEDDEGDVKTIGIYSSEESAKTAIKRLKHQTGFQDYPDGFHIGPYPLDRDHWTEGFLDL